MEFSYQFSPRNSVTSSVHGIQLPVQSVEFSYQLVTSSVTSSVRGIQLPSPWNSVQSVEFSSVHGIQLPVQSME